MTAAEALDHLAAIVERDELTPSEAAECVRVNWDWERVVSGCEMPGEVLLVANALEYRKMDSSALAAFLRRKADQERGGTSGDG